MCGGVGVVVCSHAWKLGQWVSGSSGSRVDDCTRTMVIVPCSWGQWLSHKVTMERVYKPCLTGESPQLLVVSQAGNISLLRAYALEGLGNVIPSTVQLNYSHATSQQPKISDFTLSKTVNDRKLKFSQIVHNRERMRDFSQNIVTQPLTTQK